MVSVCKMFGYLNSELQQPSATENSYSRATVISCLCLVAEVPLDDLVKQYAGAYAEGFEWPQPSSQSEEECREEAEGLCISTA